MIVNNEGRFWKENGITYDMHIEKAEKVKKRIQICPIVHAWYDELLGEINEMKDDLFYSSS
jgi:hypothetical protein